MHTPKGKCRSYRVINSPEVGFPAKAAPAQHPSFDRDY